MSCLLIPLFKSPDLRADQAVPSIASSVQLPYQDVDQPALEEVHQQAFANGFQHEIFPFDLLRKS